MNKAKFFEGKVTSIEEGGLRIKLLNLFPEDKQKALDAGGLGPCLVFLRMCSNEFDGIKQGAKIRIILEPECEE